MSRPTHSALSPAIVLAVLFLWCPLTIPASAAAEPDPVRNQVRSDESEGGKLRRDGRDGGEYARDELPNRAKHLRERWAGRDGHRTDGPGREKRGRMRRKLELTQNFVKSIEDPYQAVALAALGIRDSFKKQGSTAGAIPILEEMMSQAKDQKMRNIFLFLIRQCHQDADDEAKVLELSKQIVKENLAK